MLYQLSLNGCVWRCHISSVYDNEKGDPGCTDSIQKIMAYDYKSGSGSNHDFMTISKKVGWSADPPEVIT